jgi:hypothetical protein
MIHQPVPKRLTEAFFTDIDLRKIQLNLREENICLIATDMTRDFSSGHRLTQAPFLNILMYEFST